MSKVAAGEYRLTVSFVGFTNKSLDITVENGQDLDLGVINLSSNVKALDEVVVNGQRALVEEKWIDWFIMPTVICLQKGAMPPMF